MSGPGTEGVQRVQRVLGAACSETRTRSLGHLEVDGGGGVPVLHVPGLGHGGAGGRGHIGVRLVVHHSDLSVLLRLEQHRVELGEYKTAQLDYPGEGEGVGQDDGPDLVVSAHHVQGHEGQPVDGIDAVGEQDEPGLIESSGTLTGLESVQSSGDDQEKRKEEAGHEACVHPRADENSDVLLKDVFCRCWLKDQPAHVHTNLCIILLNISDIKCSSHDLDQGEEEADDHRGRGAGAGWLRLGREDPRDPVGLGHHSSVTQSVTKPWHKDDSSKKCLVKIIYR